jgi:hypothetical protein
MQSLGAVHPDVSLRLWRPSCLQCPSVRPGAHQAEQFLTVSQQRYQAWPTKQAAIIFADIALGNDHAA